LKRPLKVLVQALGGIEESTRGIAIAVRTHNICHAYFAKDTRCSYQTDDKYVENVLAGIEESL
jgi:hypothetical protein